MTKVELQWLGEMEFAAVPDSGHKIVMDASAEHGGSNKGVRPMELLLVGMAGCTAMDVRNILAKKRVDLTGLEIKVKAERAADHPKIFTHIELEYVVYGSDIREKDVEQAVKLSKDKYCSAANMLNKTAEITYTYRIEEVQ